MVVIRSPFSIDQDHGRGGSRAEFATPGDGALWGALRSSGDLMGRIWSINGGFGKWSIKFEGVFKKSIHFMDDGLNGAFFFGQSSIWISWIDVVTVIFTWFNHPKWEYHSWVYRLVMRNSLLWRITIVIGKLSNYLNHVPWQLAKLS